MFNALELMNQPIPEDAGNVAGWKEVPIELGSVGSGLVALGLFSPDIDGREIFTSSIYFGEKTDSPYKTVDGSLLTQFVTYNTLEYLRNAQDQLPAGHRLIVFDAYRRIELQGAFYEEFKAKLAQLKPSLSEAELVTETQKYVSMPSTDPTRPSPHNTGTAVDLSIFRLPKGYDLEVSQIDSRIRQLRGDQTPTSWQEEYGLEMHRDQLIRDRGQLLNMGTSFDWGGEEAGIAYFEKLAKQRDLTDIEVEAQRNRRLLYHVLSNNSLQPLDSEWWHWNWVLSQMGIRASGLAHNEEPEYRIARAGAATLEEEHLAHEQMRRDHRLGH